MRLSISRKSSRGTIFPFLFGRAFIEAPRLIRNGARDAADFPSFSEGLSLRHSEHVTAARLDRQFPFLFGRAFIEATSAGFPGFMEGAFPFLFGRAFIEADAVATALAPRACNFPSFSEGLSLRRSRTGMPRCHSHHFPSFSEGLSLRPSRAGR